MGVRDMCFAKSARLWVCVICALQRVPECGCASCVLQRVPDCGCASCALLQAAMHPSLGVLKTVTAVPIRPRCREVAVPIL